MALDGLIIYLLPVFIDSDALLELQSTVPTLTHDIHEADIIVANLAKPGRARFELRKLGVVTVPVSPSHAPTSDGPGDASTASKSEYDATSLNDFRDADNTLVQVVKVSWLSECLKSGTLLPTKEYLIYQGRRNGSSCKEEPRKPAISEADEVIQRAQLDSPESALKFAFPNGYKRQHKHLSPASQTKRPRLLQETTSEHDIHAHLPPIPVYLHTTYSCERSSPAHSPNDAFIEELKTIRTFRTLNDDTIGVRAYSTAIAAIAAYPYLISTPTEVARLPGCSDKIAAKWKEWKATGFLEENHNAQKDERLSVLKVFYDIWGVGETTARDFYNKGWRDLDDVIEYGWDSITRVQQIGIKYYDEFLNRIPRQEVADIGDIILEQANKIHPGFQIVIAGSYRRGSKDSGDVDVVLSNPDEATTASFVEKIVIGLENAKFITHTLTLSTRNTERGQCPLPWKGEGRKAGSGFDTLDKALVVWQDPKWDESKYKKNPNPHRRVDIIISPWKTAGCAVIGWSGGTTFERDLRRYCKKEKCLKFDSSGIRSRADGSWVDLESDLDGPAPDMLTAEKRVFAGLGLEWRPPEERVTG